MLKNASLLLLGLGILITGCDDTGTSPPASRNPIEVGVVTLSRQSVELTTELPGRVLASATAEIRPQVDGIITKQVFQEGAEVKEGDILYELDPARFKTAHDAAAASLQRAEAGLTSAQARFDRAERLSRSSTVSDQTLEDAQTELLRAKADVAAADAALRAAKIDLDDTIIRATIPGLISVSSVSPGSLVNANQAQALATVRQIDPVNVDLVDSSANLLAIRSQIETGTIDRQRGAPLPVRLMLENGRVYDQPGYIAVTSIVVSETTGTFSLRASFANPLRILLPGMFVRAAITFGSMDAYLVPQRAVTRNAAGEATAFFVRDDGKAELRVIGVDRNIGNDWLVTEGVSDGDRLVVDGLQKISDGTPVAPVDVEINEDGVVLQTIGDPQGAAPEPPQEGDGQ